MCIFFLLEASVTLKYAKMRLRPGLRPGPRWGSSRRSPRPTSRPHASRRLHSRAEAPASHPPLVFDKLNAATVAYN